MKLEKVQKISWLMVVLLAAHLVLLSFQASRSLNAFNRWCFEENESDCNIVLVEEESHSKYLQVYSLPELSTTDKPGLSPEGSGKIKAVSQSLEQQHCMEVHAPPPDLNI